MKRLIGLLSFIGFMLYAVTCSLGQTYFKVANENDAVKATATVRYGVVACTPTTTVPCWVQLAVAGSFTANNAFFGKDPDPNVVKELDVLETAVVQTVTVNGKSVTVPAAVQPPPVVTIKQQQTCTGTLVMTWYSDGSYTETTPTKLPCKDTSAAPVTP